MLDTAMRQQISINLKFLVNLITNWRFFWGLVNHSWNFLHRNGVYYVHVGKNMIIET